MRILEHDPRGRTVLRSRRSLLRPFTPPLCLTFEHERLHVRDGRGSATFRFVDVKHFELRRERLPGLKGKPSHDVMSLWLHVHLPDEPERRIQGGQLELFRVAHRPCWLTDEQAANYNRMYRALGELGFDVRAVTPHPGAPPERPFLSGELDPEPRRLGMLAEQRRAVREQDWAVMLECLHLAARLGGGIFGVAVLFLFAALFFGWVLVLGS